MTGAEPRHGWRVRLTAAFCAAFLRLWCATWRKRMLGVEQLDARIAAQQRTLVLFWHGTYLPLFALLRGRQACILTNRSLRGRVIARISRNFGYATLMLPDEQGRRFLTSLRHTLRGEIVCGAAADGPLGPCHYLKPSLVTLAAHFGYAIQVVGVAARRAWRLDGRWDRMLLPLPFTRVGLVFSEPLELPVKLTKAAAAGQAERLQAVLEQCACEARDMVRGWRPGPPVK